MHGGRIWVESDGVPGLGTRVHFTVPLAGKGLVKVSTLTGTRKPLRLPVGRGRTLLLLEPDSAIVHMLEQGLQEYQVVPVDDVSDVPRLAAELQARAVVVNQVSEDQSEQQVRQLRDKLVGSSLPIIQCSLVSDLQVGQVMGVIEYLVKPISRLALIALLDRLGEGVHRILVVDDDLQMAHLLSRMIEATARGYEAVRAYDGRDGLSKIQALRPDLILLDLIMPEMDGFAVLRQMRADPELRNIPVAVITARERTPEEERQLGSGKLLVSSAAGFTNEEVIAYLRGFLSSVSIPWSEGRTSARGSGLKFLEGAEETVQRGDEVSLGDGLAQVGSGAK